MSIARPIAVLDNSRDVTHAGMVKFNWWKDWRGQACAIIASGPSTKGSGFQKLRGRMPVIAIKESASELATWADVAYGCDVNWWKHRKGLKAFGGLKIGFDPKINAFYPDVQTIVIKDNGGSGGDKYCNDLLLDEPGVIGGGLNSGFQALNIAVQFGAARILLIGFDMRGDHWYGRNLWHKANNATDWDKQRWCKHFDRAADVLRRIGVEVVNASPHSALKCFRKTSVDQASSEWGL